MQSQAGDGSTFPKPGQKVTCHYVLTLQVQHGEADGDCDGGVFGIVMVMMMVMLMMARRSPATTYVLTLQVQLEEVDED